MAHDILVVDDEADIRMLIGGILGDEEHRLEVGGDLHARYLNEAHVLCGGDVNIVGQIDHSRVEAGGKVAAPRGRIAGGSVRAFKGIRVGQAGARGSTGTVLSAGTDWRRDEAVKARRERMARLQAARDKIQGPLSQLLALGKLDPAQTELLGKLRIKQAQIEAAERAETEAAEAETERAGREGVREIAVLAELWSGVSFRLGAATLKSDRSFEMPRLVALRRDKVRILPMGKLNEPE